MRRLKFTLLSSSNYKCVCQTVHNTMDPKTEGRIYSLIRSNILVNTNSSECTFNKLGDLLNTIITTVSINHVQGHILVPRISNKIFRSVFSYILYCFIQPFKHRIHQGGNEFSLELIKRNGLQYSYSPLPFLYNFVVVMTVELCTS